MEQPRPMDPIGQCRLSASTFRTADRQARPLSHWTLCWILSQTSWPNSQLLFKSSLSQILFIISIPFALIHSSHQFLLTPRVSSLASATYGSSRFVYPRLAPGDNQTEAANLDGSQMSRFRYQLSEAMDDSSTSSKLSRVSIIQNQLSDLRRQLEAELLNRESSSVSSLGSACVRSTDCSKFITGSHCKLDNLTCSCLPQHVEYNSTTCLPAALLGYECLMDAQCQVKVANSQCLENKCSCPEQFVAYRKDKCLPASKINDYCLADRQCQLADRHTHCHWKIPQIYGLCKCPPNYKLITGEGSRLRCAPRLGDSCWDHADCQLASPNSVCREPLKSDVLSTNWRSSGVSARRCFCGPSFELAPNRLQCLETSAGPAEQVSLSSPSVMDARHQYQFVIKATDAPPTGTTNISLSAKKEPEKPPSGRMSSLGKSCKSSVECQSRDPNSDCIQGVCECLRPSKRCSSNSTGCHKDTFQCRNGQCISWYFVCDQFKNCDDGSDEDECRSNACPPEAFQCDNGTCLALGKLCNGVRDCADGSDERLCNRPKPDRLSNNQTLGQCHPRAFKCDNGQCLPAHVFCNAVEDCADGTDESELCELVWSRRKLEPIPALSNLTGLALANSPLVKADRSAIDKMLAQLNLLARTPESRGRHAAGLFGRHKHRHSHQVRIRESRLTIEKPEERTCPRWAFTCRNGKCRSSAVLCSGVDGCGDNSDENRCQVCQCEAPTN